MLWDNLYWTNKKCEFTCMLGRFCTINSEQLGISISIYNRIGGQKIWMVCIGALTQRLFRKCWSLQVMDDLSKKLLSCSQQSLLLQVVLRKHLLTQCRLKATNSLHMALEIQKNQRKPFWAKKNPKFFPRKWFHFCLRIKYFARIGALFMTLAQRPHNSLDGFV